MDIIIRQARLMDGRVVDIGIQTGYIAALSPTLAEQATTEIQADRRLVLPAFVNGQLHACKVFWRRKLATLPAEIQALPRFQAAQFVKQTYTVADVADRVREVVHLAILNGTCALRLFADVDEDAGLTALQGLLQIKQEFAHLLTIQVVAFPQAGVLNAQTQTSMQEALRLGADIVGGIPWIEPTVAAQQSHTRMCFDLAREFNKDLHFVCDDALDPALRTLEDVARQTIATGYEGRVCATQCAALAVYADDYAAAVIALVKEAGITVFSNSHVSLVTAEYPHEPMPRGITRIRELLAAGVPVACGQDDIDNWYYPFGRNDMLEVAHFMAHNGQFAWQGEVNQVLPMVTEVPAQVMHLADYGLTIGATANVVVLDAPDWHHALQFQVDKLHVILRGQVVAQTERRQRLLV
ncbi:MAG: amidohydrolase family protein [Chloroflexi bacterium]|nr:amidohydrolase family protein [Chloroflexota bacterium]